MNWLRSPSNCQPPRRSAFKDRWRWTGAKATGVKFGGPCHHLPVLNHAKQDRVREEALAPLRLSLRQSDKSFAAVAEQSNRGGVKTRARKPFYAVKVGRLREALEPLA